MEARPELLRRLTLIVLALLPLLAGCDVRADPRITRLSTYTPNVGGELVVYGVNFPEAVQNAVSIGGMVLPEANVRTVDSRRIEVTVPAGTPNGLVTVRTPDGDLDTFDRPVQVVASVEIDPLTASPGTRLFPITARARDADGDLVPGAVLELYTDGQGTFSPNRFVTTDETGEAHATLDLSGVSTYVEVQVRASPLSATAYYSDPGSLFLGREVVLSDAAGSYPVYLHVDAQGRAAVATLNRRVTVPPIAPAAVSGPGRPVERNAGPREVIVAYRPSLAPTGSTRALLLDGAGLERVASVGRLDLVRVPEGASVEDVVARLSDDPRVEYAEPNHELYLAALPNDAHFHRQWGAFAVGAPTAWTVSDGAGVVVAVVDTAFDLTHPELAPALLPGYDFCADSGCATFDDDPHASTSVAEHGTHVAGIVAAARDDGRGTAGLAPGARVVPVKVFADGAAKTTVFTVALAIRWAAGLAVDGTAPNAYPADVINLSLSGGGFSITLAQAVDEAVAAGAVVVAATGNGYRASVDYPAALPNVIAVGAIGEDWSRGSYSNYGAGLDLVAPGSMVLSSRPGGGVHHMTGTSMASPHVAAAAALLLARDPSLSPDQVKEALKASAYLPPGADAAEFGAGVLRLDGALGMPSPTSDADRYADVTVGGHAVTLDLRDGTSSAFTLGGTEPGTDLDVRLAHGDRELTGVATEW